MRGFIRGIVIAGVIATLSACQSMPTQAYNRGDGSPLSVSLAPLGIPPDAGVRILAPAGANFGLIGALVEETRAANARDELAAVLAETGFDYRTHVRDTFAAAFKATPLELNPVPGERNEKQSLKFLPECPAATGADACLDVFFSYVGYLAAGATTDYLPTVHLKARLVRVADGTLLFQDEIQYNPIAGTKAIIVNPSEKYRYKGRDEMKADPQGVTLGLKEAIDAALAELAKQFQ